MSWMFAGLWSSWCSPVCLVCDLQIKITDRKSADRRCHHPINTSLHTACRACRARDTQQIIHGTFSNTPTFDTTQSVIAMRASSQFSVLRLILPSIKRGKKNISSSYFIKYIYTLVTFYVSIFTDITLTTASPLNETMNVSS